MKAESGVTISAHAQLPILSCRNFQNFVKKNFFDFLHVNSYMPKEFFKRDLKNSVVREKS